MNTFWSLFNWFLPAIRLPDDLRLDDPESLTGRTYALHHSRTLSTSTRHSSAQPSLGQPPRLQASESDWQRQERRKEAERAREAERAAARERDRELARERDRELARVREENRELKKRVQELERTLELSQRSVLFLTKVPPPAPLDADLGRLPESHIRRLQTDYAALQSSHVLLQQALRDRNEEVSSLRTFLSKTDVKSGAEIIQSVELLNAEIGQLAARMTDGVAGELRRQRTKIYPADFELLYPALGVPLTDMLFQQDFQPNGGLEADAMLLQIAIQAWEVACVGKILRSFCCGVSRDVEQTLSAIFHRMRIHESQATASRWRALTHSHLMAILPPPSTSSGSIPPTPVTPSSTGPAPSNSLSAITNAYADENLSGIISILALSGYHKLSRSHLKANHGSDISVITKKAFELAVVIREGIMSAAFEPVTVSPSLRKSVLSQASERQGRLRVDTDDGELFDDTLMKDGFAAAGITGENKRVLCTVELGLAYVKRKDDPIDGADGDPPSAGGSPRRHVPNGHEAARVNGNVKTNGVTHDPAEVLDRTLLLKPKVILEVALKSFAASPPDVPPESPVESSTDLP